MVFRLVDAAVELWWSWGDMKDLAGICCTGTGSRERGGKERSKS